MIIFSQVHHASTVVLFTIKLQYQVWQLFFALIFLVWGSTLC